MPCAAVLTGYGSPETLVWSEVALPAPGPGQIRLRVHAAGVGPTGLKIRRGDLREVFPLPDPAALGFEAGGRGGLRDAVELAGGPARVITRADEHAADFGVALSAPTPDRAPDAVERTMPLLASGQLRLRAQRLLPMRDAAQAHAPLEAGAVHEELVLTA
ncbi:NADPH:quinone reductase-like Zn-dependent oxidoreductase [Streptacidiphilus sp. MAP12-33]|uniref:hypothetical protein n=1 Tax=Streptacidiphilus sp. MAP12-33 TaxID=3156266 RepID=UPI003514B208